MVRDLRHSVTTAFALLVLFAGYCLATEEPATVCGKVTDAEGTPLMGVNWRISGIEEWRNGKWQLVFYSGRYPENTTGKDGRFELAFPGKVRYDLQFDKWGYGPVFLYQVSGQSEELHVVMKEGSLVRGAVTRAGSGQPCADATVVELRLPNPRDLWYKKSTLVDHNGRFQFFACPPPTPPMWDGRQEPPKWQVVCAGEVVSIDVEEGKPADEIHFEIEVKATRSPVRQAAQPDRR